MNWTELFRLKTKEEKQEERDRYEEYIFPLGKEEKSLINERLKELFPKCRLSKQELLFNFITLKQALLSKKEKEYSKWYYSPTSKYLKKEEKALMKAIVRADMKLEKLEDLPSNDAIKIKSAIYLEEPIPKKVKD